MKKSRVAVITAAMMLIGTMLVGCNSSDSQDSMGGIESTPESVAEQTLEAETEQAPVEETEQTMTEETEQTTSAEMESVITENMLDEETLNELKALFQVDSSDDWNIWYCKALTSFYSSPEKMDLDELFYTGVGDQDPSPEELDYLMQMWDEGKFDVDVHRATGEQMNEILMTYFDISLEEADLSSLSGWEYYEPTNAYFNVSGDTNVGPVDIMDGRRLENGYVELYYTDGNMNGVVTMYMQDDIWRIHSNLPVE